MRETLAPSGHNHHPTSKTLAALGLLHPATCAKQAQHTAICSRKRPACPGWRPIHQDCYPRYLGITRRSCLEAHMVLDMEYREQERLEHGPGGPISLLLSQLCPVSSTSFHHYRPGLASDRTLAP
jgi:hypothetical protein